MNNDFFNRINQEQSAGGRTGQFQNKPNNPQREEGFSSKKITDYVTRFVISFTEIIVAIFKAVLIVGGIFSLNAADVLMGTIALTILFGGSDRVAFGIPVTWIALALSMSASAIQIYFWKVLEKKHISIKDILNWKKLPNDIRTFIGLALSVAIIDTFIDVSPIPLLVMDSPYKVIPVLFNFMVGALTVLAILVCGFAEKFTSGIGDMLSDTDRKQVKETKHIEYKPNKTNTSKPKESGKNTTPRTEPSYHPVGMSSQRENLGEFLRKSAETRSPKLKD